MQANVDGDDEGVVFNFADGEIAKLGPGERAVVVREHWCIPIPLRRQHSGRGSVVWRAQQLGRNGDVGWRWRRRFAV